MFEHPSLTYRVIEFDRQQLERQAELRRFIEEHPERLVPRAEGRVRRLLRRAFGRSGRAAASRTTCEPASAR